MYDLFSFINPGGEQATAIACSFFLCKQIRQTFCDVRKEFIEEFESKVPKAVNCLEEAFEDAVSG